MQATSYADLCHDCSQINFDDAFRPTEILRQSGQRWLCNLPPEDAQQSSCRLCHFFSRVGTAPGDYRDLRAFKIGQSLLTTESSTQDGIILSITGRYNVVSNPTISPQLILNKIGPEGCSCDSVDWDILRVWLDFCSANHSTCRQRKSSSVKMNGLRVIDCETLEIVELARHDSQYATLSYVWGHPQARVLPGSRCISPGDTPQLIMDVIKATQLLGIRYLWIDRFCIRDDDKEEKHALIRNMGYIYANSCLTIITSCSDDPSQGITGFGGNVRPESWDPEVLIGDQHLTSPSIRVKQEVEGSLWNSRGWTYQEALLAPRRLVFTQSQVYFQCYEMHCFEKLGPIGVRHPVMLPPLMTVFPEQGVGSSLDDIRSRILEYSKRSLTFEADTFRAISGVLQLFADKFGFRHLCGLPVCPIASRLPASLQQHSTRGCRWMEGGLNNLVISLTWAFGYESQVDPPQPIRRRAFPSWSWVGWQFSNIATRFSLPGLPNQNVARPPALIKGHSRLLRPLHPEDQRRYCNSYCLEPCAELQVEFEDGARFPWDGGENDILSHGDSENIPRLLHIKSWVAPVVARFVPALGRNVYPTWMFRLSPGGTIFCPFADQDLEDDIDLFRQGKDASTTEDTVPCPPVQQDYQVVNLDVKDGLAGVLEFAWAINDIPSHEAGPVVPELMAVVMSACETGVVALLVTPGVGTHQYEFCGVRRFRFYPASDPEEAGIWPGEEDKPLQSPFPNVDHDASESDDEPEIFTHHRIQFEWREIILG